MVNSVGAAHILRIGAWSRAYRFRYSPTLCARSAQCRMRLVYTSVQSERDLRLRCEQPDCQSETQSVVRSEYLFALCSPARGHGAYRWPPRFAERCAWRGPHSSSGCAGQTVCAVLRLRCRPKVDIDPLGPLSKGKISDLNLYKLGFGRIAPASARKTCATSAWPDKLHIAEHESESPCI